MRSVHRFLLLLCLGCLAFLLTARTAEADAIFTNRAMTASTIAEIFIQADSVRVELEIGIQDLEAFQNLLPDELYEKLGNAPSPITERSRRFFAEDWVICPEGGAPLGGKIEHAVARQRVRRDEITGEPLPAAPGQIEIVVSVTLTYALPRRPQSLSIQPPRAQENQSVAANIGFVAYHCGLPVTDFRYFSSKETVDLDWNDPWFSRFRNRNLKRQYDAPLAAFLYVEHFEVRQEIICRPKDLQQWIDLGVAGKDVIRVEDQQVLMERVGAFLAGRNPLSIDGQHVELTLDRIHFIRRNLRRTGIVDPPEDLDLTSATLGVIFAVPTRELPQEVTMTWELFSPKIQRVPVVATDEAGGLPSFVTPDDPVLKWQNFLTNPSRPSFVELNVPPKPRKLTIPLVGLVFLFVAGFLSFKLKPPVGRVIRKTLIVLVPVLVVGILFILLAGAPGVNQSNAEAIVSGLLRNVYRAFDFRDENRIYDILERSASGPLLSQVYLETRKALEIQNQGGARVKVKEVEMLSVVSENLAGEIGFVARSVWNVSGSVGHWGHIHQRRNRYEAVFTVKPVKASWKFTEIELLEETRLEKP